ncbi:hypothetical protein CYL20_05425 [Pseudomonas palleroniana]|uniref:DUF533 domain-containing protein n=1 Tax=Pseudomonas palleroniana TaxID=191390 RepID=A0A2L1J6B3_9PSED|nr:hypothetical protein CYL20_05425 [Pseudomonas palleroniana]
MAGWSRRFIGRCACGRCYAAALRWDELRGAGVVGDGGFPGVPGVAAPAGQRAAAGDPETVDQLDGADAEAHSHAVLRALIAAAKADGKIDEQERQMISAEIGRHTDDPQLQQWLDAEVAKPLNAGDFAEYADDPAVASEIYLASVMLVNDQQEAERAYLDELAGQLQIDPQLQLHLEQQAKA